MSALIAELDLQPADPWPEPDNMQGDAIASMVQQTAAERWARSAGIVLSAAQQADVGCEVISFSDELASFREKFIACAQVRDVLVLDVFGSLRSPRQEVVEAALFGSGRPVILVPQNIVPFRNMRILIAWDATRSAVRAVYDALPILVRSQAVNVVSILDDKTFLAQDSGKMLCRSLARWGVPVQASTIDRGDRNIGATLLTAAQKMNADLLVMGGFAHGFERELMLGSATRDIFKAELPLPVLLSH
jgi:nucleotide-binding universal stress UspA family protein